MTVIKGNSDDVDYEGAFRQYLEICNKSIEANKNRFPYTEIWASRLNKHETGAKLHAIVFDDRAKAEFMLHISKDMNIEMLEQKNISSDDQWPFNYSYLKRVIDHPEEYIRDPSKLEWGWFRDVFGKGHD